MKGRKPKSIKAYKGAVLIDHYYAYNLYAIDPNSKMNWLRFRLSPRDESKRKKIYWLSYNGERFADSDDYKRIKENYGSMLKHFLEPIKETHKKYKS